MEKIRTLKRYRSIILSLVDIVVIILAYFSTYIFKDISIFDQDLYSLKTTIYTIILAIIINKIIFVAINLNKNIVRYESSRDYIKYAIATFSTAIIISVIQRVFLLNIHGIRTNLLAAFVVAIGIISYKLTLRLILNKEINLKLNKGDERRRLLVIGAGSAAKEVISTVEKTLSEEYKIVGIIDDSEYKVSYAISGYKVLGDRNHIIEVCKAHNIDDIFFAIANISNVDKKNIINICNETNIKVKVLPGVKDLIKGKGVYSNLRDVQIEDLLGREVKKLDNSLVEPLIKDKVVLVTGAGGSIGSELCRQIIKFKPKELVILDIYENNLYEIQLELLRKYPDANIKAIIASIRDKERIDKLFGEYKPYVVFHAAAHKHVPLMETSPFEAIKNNIYGTWNLINSADKHKVKRFIQISTDKAVNPTNIMGATKRMCEMMIQAKDKVSKTEYAAVRFGNVLGSNGSVIPLFKKQIASGGPVTLTHKDITRYFMTIPEAVSLVIQAMTYAEGGEIFVLDMGEPVKIYDLAKTLIKLSGFEVGTDIKIETTGLRPGEKLYEELLMDSEGLVKTKNEKIFVESPNDITVKEIDDKFTKLNTLLADKTASKEKIKAVVKEIVPTYYEPAKEETKDVK